MVLQNSQQNDSLHACQHYAHYGHVQDGKPFVEEMVLFRSNTQEVLLRIVYKDKTGASQVFELNDPVEIGMLALNLGSFADGLATPYKYAPQNP